LSLVEVVISIVIIGVMMVAALRTVAGVALGRRLDGDRYVGRMLGEQLMAEILSKAYQDPCSSESSLGPGGDEQATGNRSLFDDVDDYAGWTESPPADPNGVAIREPNWQRSVQVVWVNPFDFNDVRDLETGVKRITVTVRRDGAEVALLVALRGRTTAYP